MTADLNQALEEAIARRELERVAELVAGGADVNGLTSDGTSMLTHALDRTDVQIAELLVQHGASLTEENPVYTPLEAAIEAPAYDLIVRIVEAGADVNRKGAEERDYPIHLLARGYLEPKFFKLLIGAGADLTLLNADGQTAYEIMETNLVDNPQHGDVILKILKLLSTNKRAPWWEFWRK